MIVGFSTSYWMSFDYGNEGQTGYIKIHTGLWSVSNRYTSELCAVLFILYSSEVGENIITELNFHVR